MSGTFCLHGNTWERCGYDVRTVAGNANKYQICILGMSARTCKSPFAAGGHMVQNPKYWRAKQCATLRNKEQLTRKV